ncbi:PD-(D/E)XK nuclease superfamily protein [Sphaerochaeta associata]|nr:PD-(D/E)XK nuclease superfamily protein [Sphaerochaeta associata]
MFPTEVAARSYLVDYALHSNKRAILSERAISFDTFRSMFLKHEEHLVPANSLIRSLFVHQMLAGGLALPSLVNPRYPEANGRFISYISSILPSLREAIEAEALPLLADEMQRDLLLLYQLYQQFLAEHSLFEPRYAQPCLSGDWDLSKRYCILFTDTIGGAQDLFTSLGCPAWLTLRPTPAVKLATLEVFGNHVMEIKTTLRRIRSLLSEGVSAHSIVIGCAASDILLPVLEEEAALYDVPLVIREGKLALQYPSGRFLQRLQEVYDNQFSLESLKSLLLDPGIPYKDRELHHRFLRRAVDKSIVHGSLKTHDQFTQMLADNDLRSWYRGLKQSIIDIVTANDIEMLRRKLNHFQDTYFTPEQWKGTEGEDVYSFCLDAIDHIKSAMQRCSLVVYPNLFSYLLSYLQTKLYVPQQRKGGIAVYAWPQAATVIADHLFILALDGESAATIERPLAFLPSQIEESYRKEIDTTRANLLAASLGDGRVTLSCHAKRYEGEMLPPSLFMEEDALLNHESSPNLSEDPYLQELELYSQNQRAVARSLDSQIRFFLQASRTSLLPRRDDYTRHPIPKTLVSRLLEEREGKALLELSPTKIDLFNRCPYAWLVHYLYKVTKEDFDVQRVDHLMIGNLLHLVYQRFFSSVGNFDPALLDQYRNQLASLFDSTLTELYGSEGPTPSIRSWIIAEYREKVLAILEQEAKLFSHTQSILFEHELSFERDAMLLHGRIDRIICLNPPDGRHYAVIDYKKGEAPMTRLKEPLESYQLPLYRVLVQQVLKADASHAAYYSIKEERYRSLWTYEDSEEALLGEELLDGCLSSISDALEGGAFMATPSKQHCSGCDYRPLCRRRFATR